MSAMSGEPVEFRIVGPCQITVPVQLRENPRVKWVGSVPRNQVAREYQEADVFLFPTFSDGFGLTQLEAQAWKLPVIASRCCGDVVRHLWNGYVLTKVTAAEIVGALRMCIDEPAVLRNMSQQSGIDPKFTKAALGNRLIALID
jgi:glycosyltransferase involved in cell wall biosynthesis